MKDRLILMDEMREASQRYRNALEKILPESASKSLIIRNHCTLAAQAEIAISLLPDGPIA